MKDEDLEILLAKDAAQSFVELTKLNANHTTVRRRLYALEKIQKKGVPHQHPNELLATSASYYSLDKKGRIFYTK